MADQLDVSDSLSDVERLHRLRSDIERDARLSYVSQSSNGFSSGTINGSAALTPGKNHAENKMKSLPVANKVQAPQEEELFFSSTVRCLILYCFNNPIQVRSQREDRGVCIPPSTAYARSPALVVPCLSFFQKHIA